MKGFSPAGPNGKASSSPKQRAKATCSSSLRCCSRKKITLRSFSTSRRNRIRSLGKPPLRLTLWITVPMVMPRCSSSKPNASALACKVSETGRFPIRSYSTATPSPVRLKAGNRSATGLSSDSDCAECAASVRDTTICAAVLIAMSLYRSLPDAVAVFMILSPMDSVSSSYTEKRGRSKGSE